MHGSGCYYIKNDNFFFRIDEYDSWLWNNAIAIKWEIKELRTNGLNFYSQLYLWTALVRTPCNAIIWKYSLLALYDFND